MQSTICWLLSNFLSATIPKCLSAGLLSINSSPSLLISGITLIQVQDLAEVSYEFLLSLTIHQSKRYISNIEARKGGYIVGDHVKGLMEDKVNDINCSSIVHWCWSLHHRRPPDCSGTMCVQYLSVTSRDFTSLIKKHYSTNSWVYPKQSWGCHMHALYVQAANRQMIIKHSNMGQRRETVVTISCLCKLDSSK